MSLDRLLSPRSAVFIGGSVIEEAIEYTQANHFSGRIYAVNPFKKSLAGLSCYATLADLPEVPDIAYVAAPKEVVVETIQTLSDMGVGGAVCNSSGFSEVEGEGLERQQDFTAAAGNMPVLGPNSPGIGNYVDHCVFMQGHFGDHSKVGKGVAVISNGGAYLSDMGTANRSLPLAYVIGLGNQAVVGMADIFDAILDDDRVLAVNLYFEAILDVPKLSEAALKAIRKGVPVVVVKGGRSSAGQRAARTHTASLAGDEKIAAALFERLGFIQCSCPDEALETLKMFIYTRSPAGNRVAFSTSSGTYAVLGSDMAELMGLQLPALTQELKTSLSMYLPDYILPSNPLDISNGQYFSIERQRNIYKIFFAGDFDIAVLVMCFPPKGGWDPSTWNQMAKAFALEAKRKKLPCAFVNTLAESIPDVSREAMIDNGIVPLQGLQHGFQAVANAVQFVEQAERLSELPDEAISLPAVHGLPSAVHQIDEAKAKQILSENDIATPKSIIWDGIGDVDLGDLQFPVVVKAVSAEITHKTELGAVALKINSVDETHITLHTMQSRLVNYNINSFLIEEMVSGIAELMVGIRAVPDIGLALTLAFGGVLVELLQDAATVILPAPSSEIERALRGLKLFPVINGWRGKPAADTESVVRTIQSLCDFALKQQLVALEINPLIIRPNGQPPVAVDAVLQMGR